MFPFLYDGRNKTSINYIIIIAYEKQVLKEFDSACDDIDAVFFMSGRKPGSWGTNPDGEKEQLFNQCCVVTKAGNAPYD